MRRHEIWTPCQCHAPHGDIYGTELTGEITAKKDNDDVYWVIRMDVCNKKKGTKAAKELELTIVPWFFPHHSEAIIPSFCFLHSIA